MSKDTIYREDAIKATWKEPTYADPINILTEVRDRIEAIPSADRPQGEWKPFDLTWGRSIWYCTACEESTEVPCDIWTHKPIYKYCPNCGADMRGDNDGKDIQSADE